MDARLSKKFFYYAAPALIVAAGIFVAATDYWEWFCAPKYMERGIKAFDCGDFAAAIRDFSKAQQRCETNILARLMLGASYHEYGWHDEALNEYDTVLRLARDNGAKAAQSAGRIWFSRKDYPNARRCYEQALTFAPDSAAIWFESGQLCQASGDLPAALRCFETAAKLNPKESVFQQEAERTAKLLQGQKAVPGGSPRGL